MINRLIARMRSLDQLRFSWLDFKIGLRMLVRYPGLTLVGTVSMAVAIALGSVFFESVNQFKNPRLPIRDGDRVVSILNWNANEFEPEARSLHDFGIWREQLKTVDHLGAAVAFVRNLATEDGRVEPVRGAEITASAFRLMGTVPLLGRVLTERDERPAEAPVVVIGHTLWETRFANDPGVLGRTVKLGTVAATIVGVMPEGFAFPESQYIWTPLRVNGSTLAPGTGPAVSVFGRLASGASIEQARAELAVIGRRMAASYPKTHEHLRPRVIAYGEPILGLFFARLLNVVHGIFLMLLAVVCVNIATLVFARTATRGWEIAVRNALGASRGRIVTQLFLEALMLASVAAVFGLFVAKILMRLRLSVLGGNDTPFWINDSLSWTTMLYAALLTLFGAAIVGVLPALRITKLNVQESLRSEKGAGAGLRFGGFWTTVIVVQVAITVAFLPLAAGGVFESNRFAQRAEGIGAERYITANVGMDREDHAADSASFDARARESIAELERRISAEPGVEQVAFADRLPVMDQSTYQIELDRMTAPTTGIRTSTLVHVSRGFFAAFGTSVVAGRDFEPLDFETGRVLIVNESFTRHVFGGRNPIGQRIRIVSGDTESVVDIESVVGEEWNEIVGMVKDFGWQSPLPHEQSAMYRPALPVVGRADHLAVRVRVRDPEAFAARLRTLAAAVDPTIRLTNVQGLADVGGATLSWTLTGVGWLISFIVLLLSATGIHSLMSFTVARRTREIGIRVALGAGRGHIVAGIFWRAFVQIGAGVLAGSGLAALLGLGSARQVLLLVAADAVMLVVGLAACAVPLRRALRIDPVQALRTEG